MAVDVQAQFLSILQADRRAPPGAVTTGFVRAVHLKGAGQVKLFTTVLSWQEDEHCEWFQLLPGSTAAALESTGRAGGIPGYSQCSLGDICPTLGPASKLRHLRGSTEEEGEGNGFVRQNTTAVL